METTYEVADETDRRAITEFLAQEGQGIGNSNTLMVRKPR